MDLSSIISTPTIKFKVWDVFLAELPAGSIKEHYCIIVHIPNNNQYLYAYFTSQEDSVKKSLKNDIDALATISFEEIKDLNPTTSKKCFVKCDRNNLLLIKRSVLQEKISKGIWELIEAETPSSIIQKISNAIRASKSHNNSFKDLFEEP